MKNIYMRVSIYNDDGETIAAANQRLDSLDDDHVEQVASNLAYGLIEEAESQRE